MLKLPESPPPKPKLPNSQCKWLPLISVGKLQKEPLPAITFAAMPTAGYSQYSASAVGGDSVIAGKTAVIDNKTIDAARFLVTTSRTFL